MKVSRTKYNAEATLTIAKIDSIVNDMEDASNTLMDLLIRNKK